jgi:hypothetical protein
VEYPPPVPSNRRSNLPIIRVLEKSFLAADALDFVAKFQRAVVFAKGKLLELRPERADQRGRSPA